MALFLLSMRLTSRETNCALIVANHRALARVLPWLRPHP